MNDDGDDNQKTIIHQRTVMVLNICYALTFVRDNSVKMHPISYDK